MIIAVFNLSPLFNKCHMTVTIVSASF